LQFSYEFKNVVIRIILNALKRLLKQEIIIIKLFHFIQSKTKNRELKRKNQSLITLDEKDRIRKQVKSLFKFSSFK